MTTKDNQELLRKVDKILHYVEDDLASNTKGLISRVNILEARLENHAVFLKSLKWVFGVIAVPLTLFTIKEVIQSLMEFNAYYMIW